MKTKIYMVSLISVLFGTTLGAQTNSPATGSPEQPETSSNKRILTRLGGKSVPDNMSAETPLAIKTANITGESDRNELLKLAEALSYQARRLKNEANTLTGREKEQKLADAAQYEKNCLLKQIEASELFGVMNQVKFNSNQEHINQLIATTKLEESKMARTKALISSSEKNMKLAKDLRSEAYNSANLTTRLGSMSNAEEKEVLALGEQSLVIGILDKKNGASIKNAF